MLPHLPLLRRAGAREVLDAAAAVSRSGGEVDVDRLVAEVVAGRPPVRLPRRSVRSFDAGLEALVDIGTGMQPFRRDADQVLEALRRMVGDHLVVTRFRRTPWTEGWLHHEPERPVLVIGTLGCGRVPDLEVALGWTRAIPMLLRRGTRVTALLPVPRRHWPPALAATRTLVPWDVMTRARDTPRS